MVVKIHLGIIVYNTHENRKFNLPTGGMHTQILELLPIYEKITNFKISIFTKYTEYKPITNQLKIYIIHKFKSSKLNTVYFFIKSFIKIVQIHKKEPFHIININSYYYNILSLLLIRLFFKIPLFLKPPNDFSTLKREKFMLKTHLGLSKILFYGWHAFLKKYIVKLKKIYIQAINSTIYKNFNDLSFPKKNIINIPNGISCAKFSEINKHQMGETHFGFIGRLLKSKNLKLLLNTFLKYLSLFPKDKLFIYGSGPEEKYILDFIHHQNLEKNIIFSGFEKDKIKIYSNIDVLIQPSLGEGMSNVILEAMASNTFVIASNISGNKNIIEHKKTGLLFNPYSEEDLLKKLQFYRNNKEIISLALNNAKKVVSKEYNIELIANKIYQFLKSKL